MEEATHDLGILALSVYANAGCIAERLSPPRSPAYAPTLYQFRAYVEIGLPDRASGRGDGAAMCWSTSSTCAASPQQRGRGGQPAGDDPEELLPGHRWRWIPGSPRQSMAHFPAIKRGPAAARRPVPEEMSDCSTAAEATRSWPARRAILALLYGTGIRASECATSEEDVDLDDGTIRVTARGPSANAALNDCVVETLAVYASREPRRRRGGVLSQSPRRRGLFPPTRSTNAVRRYAQQAGIHKRVSPHRLVTRSPRIW